MIVSRRGILGMLAAGVGAAIVRPGVLMPVKPALGIARKTITIAYSTVDDAFLEGFSQTIAHTMIYAETETPTEFSGFAPVAGDTVTLNGQLYYFSDARS